MSSPDLAGRQRDDQRVRQQSKVESGYSHSDYAASLREFGHPRLLPSSRGWILERGVPGHDARDAMGCYPIFSCRDWALLGSDLHEIGDELVSLAMVTDPFGDYSEKLLSDAFPDLVAHFKDHFVADLRQPAKSFVSSHHQYYARKALEKVTVERCDHPAEIIDEWSALYSALVARHRLTGIKAFSRGAFAKQLQVPGMVVLRARREDETVGAHLWYEEGNVAYSHLTASSPAGYELMATYALSWKALEYFADKVRWIDWGAGAGLTKSGADGLTRFKRGWANDSLPAYLCGRIFDHARYLKLIRAQGSAESGYFPAYRTNEFR